ncbi:MAG: YkgJ family cysteine cluster protein, partial [Methanoregula sp.]
MDDEIPEDEPCEQCGLCCRIFGPGIAPTPANVYVWMEQGRTDILRWFVAFRENGSTPVRCTDLRPCDLGNVVVFEMRNPDTGDYVTVCPF